ncbi:hypothetical protein BDN72DRAFT_152797 [Pluteus cervinus]|uniref:Uncharacterized protein n=1 Tax=Pluteus cervinus TaxID=181527 RepID=A0ACD3B7I8_9AGAR|nr:hypothetical protein BDN72DRAFT_152797 [Pluteus cervinus]
MQSFIDAPDDIIEQIIDAVCDDFSSSLALSLCCKTLRRFTERRIFSSLFLGGSPPRSKASTLKSRCTDLHAILSANPGLASSIKTISINQPMQRTENGMWICNNPILVDVLEKLSSSPVSSLTITSHFQPEPEWASLCARFRASLHPILRQPTFQKLKISGIQNVSRELYSHCPNLRSLEISLLASKIPSCSTSVLKDLGRHDLNCLSTLKINLGFPIQSFRDDLPYRDVRIYGPTIKELRIACPFVPDSASKVDLSHLRSLTSLDMSYTRLPLDFLTRSLETIPSGHPTLKHIRIAFWPPNCDYDPTNLTFRLFVGCLTRLREPLLRLHRSSKGILQSICIRIWTPLGLSVQSFEEYTRSSLTWDHSENVLKVEF